MRRKYFLCSMGKYVCFLAVCVVMLSSCYNDDDLKNSISGLEDRMDKLEASLQSVQTDISTLKTLTDALSQNKSIASVLENEDGSYTIKFSDKTEVTIRNGENGEDAPQITVIKNEEDGIYYWGITSIDGKKTFLKDGEGKMMPVTAAAPKIRINTNTKEWEISTDGGKTWEPTGVYASGEGTGDTSLFSGVSQDDDYAYFTLKDGTILKLSKSKELKCDIFGVERTGLVDATAGRIIFNNPVPQNLGYIDRTDPEHWLEYEVSFRVTKKTLPDIISRCMTRNGTRKCAKMLDAIKAQGYKYSTLSAISVAVCDAVIPPQKDELIADADKQVSQVSKLFNRGLISENERYAQTINIWQATTDKVSKALAANLPEDNEIFMMADSGARGSMNQIKQLAGMRGLLANTAGKTIEMPIRANYREGLNILEYFVSARGARKGLADTALRTADSGYLTRRMVDVSQEVIVREIDCGTTDGLWVSEIHEGKEKIESFRERIIGRYAVGDVIDPVTGKVIVPEGKMIDLYDANDIEAAGITKLKIRSLLTCRAKIGVCAHCYGSDMANGEPVQLGESIGVIAAESIGEPGTQLTMRTFHTGGIASAEDITQGLPRVEELFESRRPKSMAIMSEISGVVSHDDTKKNVVIKVTGKDETGAEVVKSYSIPFTQHARVMPGDRVEKGDIITREGVLYPQDILAIKGLSDVQNYLISEVQKVYRLQGVEINDKHIEVIVRQMCRKVRVTDSGSSDLIGGALANRLEVENINAELQKRIDAGEQGIKLVEYQQVLLGITKAALANESFLSAASFQETTRVLTEAAIKGKVDPLAGLKENVIIGKLIPAGTGLPEVREDLARREAERDAEVAAEQAAAAQQ